MLIQIFWHQEDGNQQDRQFDRFLFQYHPQQNHLPLL